MSVDGLSNESGFKTSADFIDSDIYHSFMIGEAMFHRGCVYVTIRMMNERVRSETCTSE
jgi:hypothetical protein